MSAAHVYGRSGSNMMNDTLPTYLGNSGSLLTSFVSGITYDIPNPDISDLLPVPPDHDSGIYDMEHAVQSSHGKVIKLAGWRDEMLRLWATENRRAASDREMLSFHVLLGLSEDVIKARLGQLFEDYGVLHCSSGEGGAVQNSNECFVDNTQAMMNSFGTEIDTSEATTMFQNKDTFQDTSLSFDQHVPANESTMHQFGTLQSSQPQVPSNKHTSSSMAGVPTAAYGINGTINTTSTYFPAHDPSHHISTVTYPFTYVHQNQPLVVTKALLVLIQTIANDRIMHGCGPIRSHEIQTGKYPCTLGCGRRFKTSCDLFRHEAIVYPQNWYFCFMCDDVNKPLEKYLFTREDKMRRHCKEYHPNTFTVGAYKVANALSTFPERCTLCSHYRHRNWKDRCKHIIWHCKRGDEFGTTKDKGKGVDDILPSSQDDDSDDNDDDDDDDNDSDDDNEENGDDHSYPRDLKDEDGADEFPSDDYRYDGDGDQGPSSGQQVDSSMDIFDWDSFDSLNFPNTICLNRLTTTEEGSAELSSKHLEIRWLDRVNKKGGTASVFKVALSTDPDTGRGGETRFHAVKQYSAKHRACYDQEVEALTRLFVEDKDSLYTVRCYGTFQYLDQRGQLTLNLLLEYAESDLREYFADAPQPTTTEEIRDFWESIFSIAQALLLIHNFSNREDKSSSAAHMDLKPDNILVVNGTLKLADFGFSRFDTETFGSHVLGGTMAYGAPELYVSPNSQKDRMITPASDIWSFGCILLEAATWVLSGFQGLRSLQKLCKATVANANSHNYSCFHNGKVLKLEILEWLDYLQDATNQENIITARVIELISDHLLLCDPTLRFTATTLVNSLARILRNTRCNTQDQLFFPVNGIENLQPYSKCDAWIPSSFNEQNKTTDVSQWLLPISEDTLDVPFFWNHSALFSRCSMLPFQFPNTGVPTAHQRDKLSRTNSISSAVTSSCKQMSSSHSESRLLNDEQMRENNRYNGSLAHDTNPLTQFNYPVSCDPESTPDWFSDWILYTAFDAVDTYSPLPTISPYNLPRVLNGASGMQSSTHDLGRTKNVLISDDPDDFHPSKILDRLSQEMDQFLSGRQVKETSIHFVTDGQWSRCEEKKLWSLLSRFWYSERRRVHRARFHIHFSPASREWQQDNMLEHFAWRFPFVTVQTTPASLSDRISPVENTRYMRRVRLMSMYSAVIIDLRRKYLQHFCKVSRKVETEDPADSPPAPRRSRLHYKLPSPPQIPGECHERMHLLIDIPGFRESSGLVDEVLRRDFSGLTAQCLTFLERINFARLWQNDLHNQFYKNHPVYQKDRGMCSHSQSRSNQDRYVRHGRVAKRQLCIVGTKDRNSHVSMRLSYQHALKWLTEDGFNFKARLWWKYGLRRPTATEGRPEEYPIESRD